MDSGVLTCVRSKLATTRLRTLKIKKQKRGGGVGVTSYPIHIGGGQVALNLQISCLKLIVKLENTPWLDFLQILHRLSFSGPICLS